MATLPVLQADDGSQTKAVLPWGSERRLDITSGMAFWLHSSVSGIANTAFANGDLILFPFKSAASLAISKLFYQLSTAVASATCALAQYDHAVSGVLPFRSTLGTLDLSGTTGAPRTLSLAQNQTLAAGWIACLFTSSGSTGMRCQGATGMDLPVPMGASVPSSISPFGAYKWTGQSTFPSSLNLSTGTVQATFPQLLGLAV